MSMTIDELKIKNLETSEAPERVLVTDENSKLRASSINITDLEALEGISTEETIENRIQGIDLYLEDVEDFLSGAVTGSESSVDNTLPRFDGETGKIIKGSGVEVDDTDNVSGINALTADSVNLSKLSISEVVNSALTGQNATLAVDASKIILTNASLVSIESITSSLANISCTIVNRTGNAITLLNNIGANGVVLPNAKDLRIDIDSSVRVMKSTEAGNKFIIDGGAGSGSGGAQTLSTVFQLTADESISDWNAPTGGFSISKVDPLQGDASYILELGAAKSAIYDKAIPVDPVFRGQSLAFTLNYEMPTGGAIILLKDQADSFIEGSSFDLPASNGREKFGAVVFIPNTVTAIKFEIVSTVDLPTDTIKFDNVQLSSDLLKSVDVSDLHQQVTLVYPSMTLTETTNLDTLTKTNIKANASIFSLSTSGINIHREAKITITFYGDRSSVVGTHIFLNGDVMSSNTGRATGETGSTSYSALVSEADKVTFGSTSSTSGKITILAEARTPSIVAPVDQVSNESITFRFRGAGEALESFGDYRTYKSTGATYVQTSTLERPTQTDESMSKDGIFVTGTTRGANSTSTTPSKFEVLLPSGMCEDLVAYKDIGKSTLTSDIGLNIWSASNGHQRGMLYSYNPATGILTLDFKGVDSANTEIPLLLFSDRSTQASGYLTFKASKLAQAVAIPKTNPVAIIKDVKPRGTEGGTFTAGAWRTRTLNTLEDPFNIVTGLNANQFTLSPGVYAIEAVVPAHGVLYHTPAIMRVDDSSIVITGTVGYSSNVTTNTINTQLSGIISLSKETSLTLVHRCSTTNANGFGRAGNFAGVSEVYSQVKITKLD